MNSKTLVHYFASFKRFFSDHILACDVSSRAIQNCIHCRFQSEKCYTRTLWQKSYSRTLWQNNSQYCCAISYLGWIVIFTKLEVFQCPERKKYKEKKKKGRRKPPIWLSIRVISMVKSIISSFVYHTKLLICSNIDVSLNL